MRAIPSLMLAALLLGPVAVTQSAAAQDAAKQELKTDPQVERSQQGVPTPQGTRPPSPATSGATGHAELTDALAAVRRAPPDLNGNPVPRPNALASEPDDPAERTRSSDPSDLSGQEVR